ncbi:2-phospho-L-lactate guanylyltransferase, partial [Rhodococcus erythropolis]|nr:2-phospho-L-lactate guanylyltransferase [Rhodococcus erythropolis]
VAALAYSVGVTVYADPAPDISLTNGASPRAEETLNAALSAAAADIRAKRGVVDLVVLQADLPAMQPSELTEAVAAARSGGRSVVVDHHGTGTSALFACGESALDPRFGPESARGHANSGARPLNGQWPGLRTDVDTHADLDTVRAMGVGPATLASLTRLKATPSNSR